MGERGDGARPRVAGEGVCGGWGSVLLRLLGKD